VLPASTRAAMSEWRYRTPLEMTSSRQVKAADLTAWMQMLALTGHDVRRWEPKRLRLRLFTVPAELARTGRRVLLHLATKSPWARLAADAVSRLRALAVPG
jgi:hypothetical protein